MEYYGYFNKFQEMGTGISYVFEEERVKYLTGYAQLDLTYFFKIKDEFEIIIGNKEKVLYSGKLTFKYDSKRQCVIPNEISLSDLEKFISEKQLIYLKSKKKLIDDVFILNAEVKESEFLRREIKNFLDSEVPGKLKELKFQFSQTKKYHELIFGKEEDFISFLLEKKDFLFGSTPFEILMRGDGSHLIQWLKDRS